MDRIYLAMEEGLEIRERDGEDWRVSSADPAAQLECLAAAPEVPDRLLLGTFDRGLLRSVDAGKSFERVGTEVIKPDAVTSLAIDPADPDVILAGTEPSRLYRSTDGGRTWRAIDGIVDVPSSSEWSFPPRPDTHHVRWVTIAPEDPDRWYVGIEAGAFLLTTDGGATWIDRPAGSRRDNHWIATHPAAPDRVYAAAGDGYAESTDGGEGWTHPQGGLEHRYVWSVAVDPGDPDTRFVSAAHGAGRAHNPGRAETYVYRRRGDSPWERLEEFPAGAGVARPVLAPGVRAGEIVAASNQGIVRSGDGGETWEPVPGAWPDAYRETVPRDIVCLPS